jgi:hypothetical protein
VNQPVKDTIGQCGIAHLLVPARDPQLRSQDRGAYLIAIFADSPRMRRSGSDSGAMAQSSITRTSMPASRTSKLRRLPSARAIARFPVGISDRLQPETMIGIIPER